MNRGLGPRFLRTVEGSRSPRSLLLPIADLQVLWVVAAWSVLHLVLPVAFLVPHEKLPVSFALPLPLRIELACLCNNGTVLKEPGSHLFCW